MTAQTILPANTLSSGYDVANSVRLFSNTFLHKTPTGNSNKQVFTFSTWLKRGNLTAEMGIFTAGNDSNRNGFFTVMFTDADELNIQFYDGAFDDLKTNRKFRDVSAWYHIVVAVDTTDGTAANRIKVYVNGVQESSFASSDYPDQNQNFDINEDANDVYVGVRRNTGGSPAGYYDGYIAEAVLIDGSQLAADQFGEFDEDSPTIWKPIDVSGLTFGTNGFYLDFEDSGTLGNDVSGGTDLTEVNIAATDQTTDTCTNNFATLNALDNFYFSGTLSEGNVKVVSDGGVESYITNTIPVSTGKWYWEIKITASGSGKDFVGIVDKVSDNTDFSPYSGNSQAISYYGSTGHSKAGSTSTNESYGDTFTAGDIIGVAMDLVNNKLYFSKNGTFQNSGDPTSGSTGTGALAIPASPVDGVYYSQFANIHNTASTFEANYGNPSFSISSGNADANGHGNFEYAVPSGYFALCSKNLAENG